MSARASAHRVRISATLDPGLARAVESYLAEHDELDRSAVINEALLLWVSRRQEIAIAAQYAVDAEQPPASEWAAWHAVKQAAGRRRAAPTAP